MGTLDKAVGFTAIKDEIARLEKPTLQLFDNATHRIMEVLNNQCSHTLGQQGFHVLMCLVKKMGNANKYT